MIAKMGNRRDGARLMAAALLAGTAMTSGATLFAAPAAAQASGETHAYAIPAGTLSDALNRFAEQSGLQLNYDAALTQGRTSSGLAGQMPWRDALARLLSGTGLVPRTTGADAVTIGRATTGAMTLDTLEVEGRAATALAAGTDEGNAADYDEDERAGRNSPILVTGHNQQIDVAASTGPWGGKAIVDTPYSINVTSSDLIENVVASSMDQMFKMNPVVQNSAPSTVYGTPYVTIRGFDSQKGVVDGLRLSSTLTGISMEELQQVEIMNGLSGFMYGAGNPGGVTNYVLKRPTYSRTMDVTLGNYGNEQFFAHLDMGNRIDADGVLAYRLNVAYQDGETAKKNQNIARTLISGAVDWNVTPNLLVQVEGAHTYYRIDGIDSRFYAYANSSYGALNYWIDPLENDQTYTPPWTFLQVKTDRIGVNAKWKIDDTFSLRTAYIYKRDAQESLNIYPAFFADSGFVNGWPSRSAPSYNIAQGAYAYLDSEFHTGGIRHRLTLGVSGDVLRVKRHVVSSVSAVQSPAYTDPNDLMTWAMPDALNTYDWGALYRSAFSKNTNVVLGDDIQFTEQFGALVGVNRTTLVSKNYTATGAVSSGYDKTAYTPTVSLVFKPVPRVTTYASYMQGLEQGSTVPDDATLYNNPGQILKPFISKQVELGAKYAPIDALLITAAIYRIEKANSYEDRSSDGKITINQDGLQVHKGIELTATGHVTGNLSVLVGGSIMDLAVKKATNAALAGKRPTGVSDMLAKIYLDYAIPVVPGLSVSAGAYHSGKMYKDPANLQEIQGNTVFDLGLHYATRIDGHAVRFDLSATNLTDKNYWITTSQLGIPRNVAFSMKFGF